MIQIVPSILSADFAHLADQIGLMEQGGAQMLHVDIMDGHFVPNLTIGPSVVKSIRRATKLALDVHLMITQPDQFAPLFIDAGADLVSVHYEAATHIDRTLRMIRDRGARPGVVLNPGTPVSVLEDVLYLVDHVLVMSVNPGFEAQQFIPHALEKVRRLDRMRAERRLSFSIEIDGGVALSNTEEIVRAGCDWLVSGSSIFHSEDPTATVKQMQQIAAGALAIRI